MEGTCPHMDSDKLWLEMPIGVLILRSAYSAVTLSLLLTQNQAHSWVIDLASQHIVNDIDIEVELADVLRLKLSGFQLDDEVAM